MFDQDAWDKKQRRLAAALRGNGSGGAVRVDPDDGRELTLEECNELVTKRLDGTLAEPPPDDLDKLVQEWGKDSASSPWTRDRILGLIRKR